MSDPHLETQDEMIRRFRQHSVTLNSVAWDIAEALGKIGPDDTVATLSKNVVGELADLLSRKDHDISLQADLLSRLRSEVDAQHAEMLRIAVRLTVALGQDAPENPVLHPHTLGMLVDAVERRLGAQQ